MEFSKRLISDIRALLWVVTVGGLLLAAYCVHADYAGYSERVIKDAKRRAYAKIADAINNG